MAQFRRQRSALSRMSDRVGGGAPRGSVMFRDTGTYTWVVPEGVYSICAVAIGSSGVGVQRSSGSPNTAPGGGGGALSWGNNMPVSPGQAITVVVPPRANSSGNTGANGAAATVNGTWIVANGGFGATSATPGAGGVSAGTYRQGGGNGGAGGLKTGEAGGGGGAGGYLDDGGDGGTTSTPPEEGAGGSGAGGAGIASGRGTGGGGVDLFGLGADGLAPSGGGSGGSDAPTSGVSQGNGGAFYGGGAAGSNNNAQARTGGAGAVRIIWGEGRAFPSTDVGQEV